jgi:AraC-like DNA-binding protein
MENRYTRPGVPERPAVKRELRRTHADLLDGVRFRYCGRHDCPAGYAYGPVARDEHIVHFVCEGSGRYQIGHSLFHVSAGTSFVLFPGFMLHYQADKADPWRYYWAAFDGPRADELVRRLGFSPTRPLVAHRKPMTVLRLFEQMLSGASTRSLRGDCSATAAFHRLLAVLLDDAERCTDGVPRVAHVPMDVHVLKAISLIQEGYPQTDFSIETVADQVCLERSYFSKLFKTATGQSPHEYLTRTRLEASRRLLEESSAPVKEIALAVGFKEQGYFDKVFRRNTGCSPSEFRRAVLSHATDEAGAGESELTRSLSS